MIPALGTMVDAVQQDAFVILVHAQVRLLEKRLHHSQTSLHVAFTIVRAFVGQDSSPVATILALQSQRLSYRRARDH